MGRIAVDVKWMVLRGIVVVVVGFVVGEGRVLFFEVEKDLLCNGG